MTTTTLIQNSVITEEDRPPDIIGYHRKCHDGFASAAVANLAAQKSGRKVVFVALDPNRLVDGVKDLLGQGFDPRSRVRIFDVAFSPEAFSLLKNAFSDLLIFDHHKSTVDDFNGELPPEIYYQVSDSGATLAWKYFFPDKEDEMPLFLRYILARDTWNWTLFGDSQDKIQDTQRICLALYEACRPDTYLDKEKREPDFTIWNSYLENNDWVGAAREHGRLLEEHQKIVLDDLKKSSTQVRFGDHQVSICNSPVEISDLGNRLARETACDYALIWRSSGTRIFVSLRSVGDFDVSAIARQYPPGGGHKNAAAFSCPRHHFWLTQYKLTIPKPNQVMTFLMEMSVFYNSEHEREIEAASAKISSSY